MNQSMAMVQLRPDLAKAGIELSVRGEDKTYKATTHTLPFYDPTKGKRTAVG
jgi:glycine cleavage system aminomethyltransferase T